jgi:hypothetical protein
MAVESSHDYPPNGMAGILAYDSVTGKWVVLACSSAGILAVAAASLPLPSGAATAAKQLPDDHNVTVSNMITGFATATKQDTLNSNVPHAGATPTVYNKTMTAANTEYSQALPANVKKFLIKCRTEYAIKVCFTAEASGTTYVTVGAGQSYWEDGIKAASLTLYFQCATAGQAVEIIAWA